MVKNRIWITRVVILTYIFALSFIFALQSPNNVWRISDCNTDTSVFKYMAYLIEKGYMPYRDGFDHKGPLIYIINYLGMQIAFWRGVWVIEFLTLFITFLLIYKIARLECNRIISTIVVLISTATLFQYYHLGNLVEEYALPFIALSLYIFSDYFISNKINKVRLVFCGLSFAAVFLLRQNMITLWLVMIIGVIVSCVKRKAYKDLGKYILFFSAGVLMLVMPILLWLIQGDALRAFFEDYFVFNMVYTSSAGGRATALAKQQSFIHFMNNTIILVAITISIFFAYLKRTIFHFCYSVYLFMSMLLICLSGQIFSHYGMVLVPAISYPIAIFLEYCAREKSNQILTFAVIQYFLVTFALPQWLTAIDWACVVYAHRGEASAFSVDVRETCTYIENYSDEDDRIIVQGNWDIIYVLSNRLAASKYSYQAPICDVMPSLADEYYSELNENSPKLIVLKKDVWQYDRMLQYISDNNYERIGLTTSGEVAVYKRPW